MRSGARISRALRTKIALHGELSHLGLQVSNPTLGVFGDGVAVLEDLAGVFKKLLAPGGDLGGVHPVARSEFGESGVALQRLEGDTGLELR